VGRFPFPFHSTRSPQNDAPAVGQGPVCRRRLVALDVCSWLGHRLRMNELVWIGTRINKATRSHRPPRRTARARCRR
jgi:hypothetical protein